MARVLRGCVSFFLAVVCVTGSIACHASAPETSAAAFILMEAESGRILASRNETQERSIASTTKIMTCLVALEHSELTDQVTVRREHLREGSSMYLFEGETLTMEELLYGLMLPSGNDAAECIAAYCGGSGGSAQFVGWMNDKAKALGMEHTSLPIRADWMNRGTVPVPLIWRALRRMPCRTRRLRASFRRARRASAHAR